MTVPLTARQAAAVAELLRVTVRPGKLTTLADPGCYGPVRLDAGDRHWVIALGGTQISDDEVKAA